MNIFRIKKCRFAETVSVGDAGEELRFIDTTDIKHSRYEIVNFDNMVYIYDKKKEIMYCTSNANIRLAILDTAPTPVLDFINKLITVDKSEKKESKTANK